MKITNLRIISRKSPLALAQAKIVQDKLIKLHPHLNITITGITTQGDRILDKSLQKIGGKGLFIKELEQHLLAGNADIAVHSLKDLPYQLPKGLMIGAILERESPFDALVATNNIKSIADLPFKAIIGTSSLRRQCQLLATRNDLIIQPLRGNINTRLNKLKSGEFTAIILAEAGLTRLKLQHHINNTIDSHLMLPAVGQGVLGIECLQNAHEVQEIIAPLNHTASSLCITAERSMNSTLQGSCHTPIAGFSEFNKTLDQITLTGMVGKPDGSLILKSQHIAPSCDAIQLGEKVACDLKEQGANAILGM